MSAGVTRHNGLPSSRLVCSAADAMSDHGALDADGPEVRFRFSLPRRAGKRDAGSCEGSQMRGFKQRRAVLRCRDGNAELAETCGLVAPSDPIRSLDQPSRRVSRFAFGNVFAHDALVSL